MSKKILRAEQARMRRALSKISLDLLHAKATIENSQLNEDADYSERKNKQFLFLTNERERAMKYRKIKKAGKHKASRNTKNPNFQQDYRTDKLRSNRKVLDRKKRNKFRLQKIQFQLKRGKEIKNRWVKYRNEKLSPLGACCKAGHFTGVQYLLDSKANPTLAISSTGARALDEVCWLGYADIACLLVNYGAVQSGRTYGGLHGAIHKGLHKAVTCLIKNGCDVNEYFFDGTPLRAALTCGVRNSGDVRMVRKLLVAGANVRSTTAGGIDTFAPGLSTTHTQLAKKYSNVKCCKAITLAYK